MSSSDDRRLTPDQSNGYEALAQEFIASRERSNVGAEKVAAWAQSLAAHSTVMDLACGSGLPITKTLIDAGHDVFAIDASPTMVERFRERFPDVPIACEAIETSSFFDRTFDAAVAWGVMFLLPAKVQPQVIRRVAGAMKPNGRFLFTAPSQIGTWNDLLTARQSVSLGRDAYVRELSAAGFTLVDEFDDEGENHYYDVLRTAEARA